MSSVRPVAGSEASSEVCRVMMWGGCGGDRLRGRMPQNTLEYGRERLTRFGLAIQPPRGCDRDR
ncbi:MAG: hypothetical protein VX346_16390 [Planctomycetota bacterium]|nr:hypothetical protein [Planctomycetota bacterium]